MQSCVFLDMGLGIALLHLAKSTSVLSQLDTSLEEAVLSGSLPLLASDLVLVASVHAAHSGTHAAANDALLALLEMCP